MTSNPPFAAFKCHSPLSCGREKSYVLFTPKLKVHLKLLGFLPKNNFAPRSFPENDNFA